MPRPIPAPRTADAEPLPAFGLDLELDLRLGELRSEVEAGAEETGGAAATDVLSSTPNTLMPVVLTALCSLAYPLGI